MTLKQLRIEKKLKQIELAEIIGVNQSIISQYENGIFEPNVKMIIELSKVFDVPIETVARAILSSKK